MLADIAHGNTNEADILFLVAFILFVIGTVLAIIHKTIETAIMLAGFACLALAWLLL